MIDLTFNTDILACIAAFFKSCAFLPQAFSVLRTRRTDGLSIITYGVLIIGIGLWLFYGLLNQIWPLAIASMISLTLAFAIFVIILYNKKTRMKAYYRLKTRRFALH